MISPGRWPRGRLALLGSAVFAALALVLVPDGTTLRRVVMFGVIFLGAGYPTLVALAPRHSSPPPIVLAYVVILSLFQVGLVAGALAVSPLGLGADSFSRALAASVVGAASVAAWRSRPSLVDGAGTSRPALTLASSGAERVAMICLVLAAIYLSWNTVAMTTATRPGEEFLSVAILPPAPSDALVGDPFTFFVEINGTRSVGARLALSIEPGDGRVSEGAELLTVEGPSRLRYGVTLATPGTHRVLVSLTSEAQVGGVESWFWVVAR